MEIDFSEKDKEYTAYKNNIAITKPQSLINTAKEFTESRISTGNILSSDTKAVAEPKG